MQMILREVFSESDCRMAQNKNKKDCAGLLTVLNQSDESCFRSALYNCGGQIVKLVVPAHKLFDNFMILSS